MEEKKSNRGGPRPGSGRPKGSLQKTPKIQYETNFHVRCSFAQRDLLKAYWNTIKHI